MESGVSEGNYSTWVSAGSIHLHFDEHKPEEFAKTFADAVEEWPQLLDSKRQLTIVCRRGNDSQRAVEVLRNSLSIDAVDLKGGLTEWNRRADPSFPLL